MFTTRPSLIFRPSLFFFMLFLFFTGCYIEPTSADGDSMPIEGYRPVYGTPDRSEITFLQPQSIENPGKIYRYGKYLLVNEQKKGIHLFDNTDPQAPLNIGFIQMLGNTDMAIKDGVLYADHLGSLVALTTDDFTTVQEKGRLPLRNWNLGMPPPAGFHFECVDPAKGLVVSWKKVELKNPQCYALR